MTSRKQLTALEAGALRASLMKLMKETSYFDICRFDQMCKVYGAIADSRDYAALRLLHCIDWRDMEPETRKAAQDAVFRTFAPDNHTADLWADAFREPTKEKVSFLKRLTGGVS